MAVAAVTDFVVVADSVVAAAATAVVDHLETRTVPRSSSAKQHRLSLPCR